MRVSAITALFIATVPFQPFQGAFAYAQAGVKAVSFSFAKLAPLLG
jgi:hypothetical protein